jgi:hypothetical protein
MVKMLNAEVPQTSMLGEANESCQVVGWRVTPSAST